MAGARWLLWLWNRVAQARGKSPAGSSLAKIPSDRPGDDLARLAVDCIRELSPEPGSGRQTRHGARKRAQAGQARAKKVASARFAYEHSVDASSSRRGKQASQQPEGL